MITSCHLLLNDQWHSHNKPVARSRPLVWVEQVWNFAMNGFQTTQPKPVFLGCESLWNSYIVQNIICGYFYTDYFINQCFLFSVCADVCEADEETTEGAQLFKEEAREGGWLERPGRHTASGYSLITLNC